jgi:hypothetical protein
MSRAWLNLNASHPKDCDRLAEWDDGTLEASEGREFFTSASDIYQIGRMLHSVRQDSWSCQFSSFVTMLLSKKVHSEGVEVPLDGTRALQHEWITMNN